MILSHCSSCDGNFIVSLTVEIDICPYCGGSVLTYLDETEDKPVYTHAPEQMLPFSVPKETLQQNVATFVKKSWFTPEDLTPQNLNGRLQPLYLPFWLVDATTQARWQAEVGFDYQIVSHREKYGDSGWQSEKIKETKIRWEPRVGNLQRRYDNQTAPALEEHAQWRKLLGSFKTESPEPYQAESVAGVMVRLPNRPPGDAWPEAEATLKTAATAEVCQAAKADHIRQFRWSAAHSDQNWTQMLVPIFASYYRDDDDVIRMVYAHGQTGELAGQQRASLKKAKRYSKFIAIGAAVLFTVSLILGMIGYFESTVLPWAVIGFMAAVGLAITAVIPLLIAYSINNWGMFTNAHQQRLADLREAIQE
jgi:Zn-finger nucleic acid-binding protein